MNQSPTLSCFTVTRCTSPTIGRDSQNLYHRPLSRILATGQPPAFFFSWRSILHWPLANVFLSWRKANGYVGWCCDVYLRNPISALPISTFSKNQENDNVVFGLRVELLLHQAYSPNALRTTEKRLVNSIKQIEQCPRVGISPVRILCHAFQLCQVLGESISPRVLVSVTLAIYPIVTAYQCDEVIMHMAERA